MRAESVTATLVYTYNAAGLRVAQSVDGNASTYAWDWATGVPELLSDGDALYLVGHDTLGHWDGEAWQYPLPDGLGSARQAVDAGATVVATREWTPYGVEVNGAQSGLGFTGEWFDAEVGLQYLRARWYDAEVGRFTSRDPWEGDDRQPQTLHAYVYALGNPMNFTDPSGKRPWPDPEPWRCHVPPSTDTFRFSQLPILQPRLYSVQWFGNTVFASEHRAWYTYSQGLHAGFDLFAPAGSPIFAGLYGTVVSVYRNSRYFAPNYIVVRPTSGLLKYLYIVNRVVFYGHLGAPTVEVGEEVVPATIVGTTVAEATGGPHLHLEIRDYKDHYPYFSANSWFYNPAYYLNGSDMSTLISVAEKQEARTPVTFTGEDVGTGNPYTQPERIPR